MAGRPSGGGPKRFLSHYESTVEAVRGSLREYLGDPNDKNTHQLRSALRRLDTAFRVIPKRTKKEDTSLEDYEGRCRKLLRLTSEISDSDMLSKMLEPRSTEPAVAAIRRELKSQRRKHADDSMKAAWKLFETRTPKLDAKMILGLETHARKVMTELETKVQRDLVRVVASESRVKELHSLRKRCKRLRYTIELLPPSPNRVTRAELLRKWQDSLGAIRDSDVLIERLARKDASSGSRKVLKDERLRRHTMYLTFVRAYRSKPSGGRSKAKAAD
jgi:CHAD domain-containing protein